MAASFSGPSNYFAEIFTEAINLALRTDWTYGILWLFPDILRATILIPVTTKSARPI
jgi:hypothetical protein